MSLPSNSSVPVTSYFWEPASSHILYGHIAFMFLSWMVVLPICVMLDLAQSNLYYLSQILFLGLHGIGIIFGLAYNSRTPDLYANNVHYKVAWALSGIVVLNVITRLPKIFKQRKQETIRSGQERQRYVSHLEAVMEEDHQGLESNLLESETSTPRAASVDGDNTDTLYDVSFAPTQLRSEERYYEPMSWGRRWSNISGSYRFIQTLELFWHIFNILLVILGFVAICTGIVVMAGIFRNKHVYNGLAHFIKGSVFLAYGILTLSRWMGCFAESGWAWNLKPINEINEWKPKRSISMEVVECSLIFIYGISNIFLEHLTAWGEAWSPQDFEHVAISLLFIGAGLCGMIIESQTLRGLFNHDEAEVTAQYHDAAKPCQSSQPGYSINPIPAMTIFVLGIILGGHHQSSMESTMMHKFVGNLLTGASAARFTTYIIIYISPPTSASPARPPSELVSSFCLISGGVMLMASNKDTVAAMIENKIGAMLVMTVIMGLSAVFMAWCIVVVLVRYWAERREKKYLRVKDNLR